MSNEHKLINEIADNHNDENDNKSNVPMDNILVTPKITLLNDDINTQQGDNESKKGIGGKSSVNSNLTKQQLMQKYSEVIKKSIENESNRGNSLNRHNTFNKRGHSHRPFSPSTPASWYTNISTRIKNKSKAEQYSNDHLSGKYEKYNMQNLAYEIEREFSRVNSTNEVFNERLKFYAAKQKIKDEKINELIDLAKPHIEAKDQIKTFNRLINDAQRRYEAKKHSDKQPSDILLMNTMRTNHYSNCNSTSKRSNHKRSASVKINNKEWGKIYQERFMSKLTERNEKIKQQQLEKENKKKEEEKIFEEEIERRRKFVSRKELDAISMRLYTKNNKDIYKKAKDLHLSNLTTIDRLTAYKSLKNSCKTKKSFSKYGGNDYTNYNNNYCFCNNSQEEDKKESHNVSSMKKAEQLIDHFFLK